MSKVEVDIYMNNLISFFDKNPKDLFSLIGKIEKDVFYVEVRSKAFDNIKNGEDVQLTQKQFLDILVKLHKKESESLELIVDKVFVKTKFGDFCLN